VVLSFKNQINKELLYLIMSQFNSLVDVNLNDGIYFNYFLIELSDDLKAKPDFFERQNDG